MKQRISFINDNSNKLFDSTITTSSPIEIPQKGETITMTSNGLRVVFTVKDRTFGLEQDKDGLVWNIILSGTFLTTH